MKEKWILYFALGVVAVVSMGQTMGIRNDGIQFPDGSLQTTAAAAAGDPVQFVGLCALADDQHITSQTMYTVPSGQRLEIEFVGLVAFNLAPAETVLPMIGTSFGGDTTLFVFEEFVGGTSYPLTGLTIKGKRPSTVRMYADPESSVVCQVFSTTNIGTDREIQMNVSGRLVDVTY